MSPTTDPRIDALREMIGALERADRDQFQRLIGEWVHPDCEWFSRLAVVQGRSYEGREGMVAWFDDFLDSFDEVRYVGPEFRPIGDDTVLVLITLQVHGRESGVEMAQELGVVYEFDDGLLRRGRVYESHAEAIEAAEALHA
ncbi:MAG: nuclear transport factor 2 family protein [Thermoleophilaceae bacterium]